MVLVECLFQPTELCKIWGSVQAPQQNVGCRGGRVKYRPISRINDYSPIKNKLNLSVWNSQLVCNKTDKLCDYVTDHDIDILCLTETWLRPEDPVVIGELSPPGYTFINVPRENAEDHHGGVGVLFKSQLHLGLLKTDIQFPKYDTFQYTVVSNTSRTLTIIVVYRTPPSTKNQLKVPGGGLVKYDLGRDVPLRLEK